MGYHWTSSDRQFKEFDRKKIREFDPDTNIAGFFFSSDPDAWRGHKGVKREGEDPGRLVSAYLKLGRTIDRKSGQAAVQKQNAGLERPVAVGGEKLEFFPRGYDSVIFQKGLELTEAKRVQFERDGFIDEPNPGGFKTPITFKQGEPGTHRFGPGENDYVDYPAGVDEYSGRELIVGHDDLAGAYSIHQDSTYIIKDPNQIKSAEPVTYDDNGNVIPLHDRFNLDSDDIRYIPAYHGTPHTFAAEEGAPLGKFSTDKIGSGEGAQAH